VIKHIVLCVTTFIFLVVTSALSIKFNIGGLYLLGLCSGVGIGVAFSLCMAFVSLYDIEDRITINTQSFAEEWIKPKITYVNPNPTLLAALDKVTDEAVHNGRCKFCGSENFILLSDRWGVEGHYKDCRIPFARYQLEKIKSRSIEVPETEVRPVRNTVRKLNGKSSVLKILSATRT